MCGRFTQTATPETVAAQFRLDPDSLPSFKPRYNISPSQHVLAVRHSPESLKREAVMLRWGLIPSWAKDTKIGNQCINAKAETVAEKPSFRAAFKKRRCLIIADGFYEWQAQGKRKQPMWIGLEGRRLFALAGLWEHWQPPEGDALETCTIITTEPNALTAEIHNRMPVILSPEHYDTWLDPTMQEVKALLSPYAAHDMVAYPVSTLVNDPRHDLPQCLEPVS
jgi:putative SOS response-associated peptidase YedK